MEEEPAEAAAVEAAAAVAEAFDADVFRWSPEQSAAVAAPRSVKKPLAVVAAPTINTPRPGAQVQRSKPFWQIRLERAAAAAEAAEAAVAEAAAAVEAAAAEEEPEEEGQEAAEAEAAATASPAPEVIVGAQSTAHQDDGSPIWNALLAAAAADDEGAAATLLRSPICSPTLVMAIDEAARASCRGIVRPRHPSQGAAPEARQSAAEVAAAEAAAAAALAAAAEAALAEARRENEELRAELHALRLSFLPRHGPRRSASLKRLASRKLSAAKAAASELAGATGATLKFDFEVAASAASSAVAAGARARRRSFTAAEAAAVAAKARCEPAAAAASQRAATAAAATAAAAAAAKLRIERAAALAAVRCEPAAAKGGGGGGQGVAEGGHRRVRRGGGGLARPAPVVHGRGGGGGRSQGSLRAGGGEGGGSRLGGGGEGGGGGYARPAALVHGGRSGGDARALVLGERGRRRAPAGRRCRAAPQGGFARRGGAAAAAAAWRVAQSDQEDGERVAAQGRREGEAHPSRGGLPTEGGDAAAEAGGDPAGVQHRCVTASGLVSMCVIQLRTLSFSQSLSHDITALRLCMRFCAPHAGGVGLGGVVAFGVKLDAGPIPEKSLQ